MTIQTAPRFSLAVLFILTALGCHTASRRPVQVNGAKECVRLLDHGQTREVPLTLARSKLRDVLRASGRLEPEVLKDPFGRDIGQFVRLNRPDGDVYIHHNVALLTESSLGDILLLPGETLEFVPWTETELIRGRKLTFRSAVPPPASHDLLEIYNWFVELPREKTITKADKTAFANTLDPVGKAKLLAKMQGGSLSGPANAAELPKWYADFKRIAFEEAKLLAPVLAMPKDQEYLNRLYGEALRKAPASRVLEVPVQLEAEDDGMPVAIMESAKAKQTEDKSQFDIFPVNLQTVVSIANRSRASLYVIERVTEGRTQTFILSAGYDVDGTPIPEIVPIPQTIVGGLFLFDGDRVMFSNPDNIPIVAASLLVNKQVVQPALARQRDAKCAKIPRFADRWNPLAAAQSGR